MQWQLIHRALLYLVEVKKIFRDQTLLLVKIKYPLESEEPRTSSGNVLATILWFLRALTQIKTLSHLFWVNIYFDNLKKTLESLFRKKKMFNCVFERKCHWFVNSNWKPLILEHFVIKNEANYFSSDEYPLKNNNSSRL